ncbi:MAG: class I SAM-dependent methyltransferase [Kiritimatiellia bacterium]|nr:class I SAM-dependent methyltransferase [Kiritimatiellia bacterium]
MISSAHRRFDFGTMASDYDAWYETDAGRLHDATQKQAVLSMLPSAAAGKRGSLLDVGCGTGHWSVFFAEHGFDVTGIDVSPKMIAVAQARNALHCRFAVADVIKLPFLNGDFDLVSAMTVLEFVPDARRTCAEMMRCLKSGGFLMAGVLNRLTRINRERIAARAEPYASARMFAPEELRKLLSEFGDVNILVTTEHEMGGGESGALIIAAVIKP